MTRSPVWNRGATASVTRRLAGADGLHPATEFIHRNDAALEQRLGDRVNPAFVVGHLVVGYWVEALDIAAELIHADKPRILAAEQHEKCVDALFPQRVVVLGGLDSARGEATHVMVTARGSRIGHV